MTSFMNHGICDVMNFLNIGMYGNARINKGIQQHVPIVIDYSNLNHP